MSKKTNPNTTTAKPKNSASKSSRTTTTTTTGKATTTKKMEAGRSSWLILSIVVAVVSIAAVLAQDNHGEPVPPAVPKPDAVRNKEEPKKKTRASLNSDAASIINGDGGSGVKRTKLSELFDVACTQTGMATCAMKYLEIDDEGRTVTAKKKIPRSQQLIEVQHEMQITTLRAVRDPRIRSLLDAQPVERLTGNAPLGRTVLAVYLVLESKRLRATTPSADEDSSSSPRDRVHRAYFDYLPTLEDFLLFHPTAKKIFEIKDRLLDDDGSDDPPFSLLLDQNIIDDGSDDPPFSPFLDQNIINVARQVIYDYKALSEASEDFSNDVSFEDFAWANLLVSSRAYGGRQDVDDDDEREWLASRLRNEGKDQLDVTMVPLLDSFNDRRDDNVQWNFNHPGASDYRATTLYALRGVNAGEELLVNYGRSHTDYQRMSQYGFAVTNGSEISLATLAPYHRPAFVVPVDEEDGYVEIRKRKLFKYLNFGDGYEECPEPDLVEGNGYLRDGMGGDRNGTGLFQYARYKALLDIFHRTEYWYVVMPTTTTTTAKDKKKPPISDHVMTMCRVLAMTDRDYDGLATPLLWKLSRDPTYETLNPSRDDSLEYRAYHVLERLAAETASEIREISDAEAALRTTEDPTSPEGMRAFVLSHEIESLESVVELARKKKKFYLAKKRKKLDNGKEVNEEDYVVRTEACPLPKVPFDWTPYVK